MTSKVNQLREQRKELVREANNMLESVAPSDWKRGDHGEKYDAITDKIADIDSLIEAHQKALDQSAEKAFADAGVKISDSADVTNAKRREIDAKWMRGGDRALTNDDWAIVRNTMSTTTEAQGGYSVQSDVAGQVIQLLKEHGGMREVAQQITTEKGNPLSFPTSDNTAQVGEWIAENETATDLDPQFGTAAVNAFKASSKVITVPIELIQDSQIDVVQFVTGQIVERLSRTMNAGFTTGGGTTNPFGVVTRAGNSGFTVSALTGVDYDDILDLQHSVDPAYRRNGRFMFNDATLKAVRKLKDEDGRPLFVPSYDLSIQGGASGTLAGSPYTINQDMASLEASAKFMLYGDFSRYLIRDVMQLTLFRFDDSAYAKKGQVGFLAWMRAGGNLLDTSAVKYLSGAAS